MPPNATQINEIGITSWSDYATQQKNTSISMNEANHIRISGSDATVPVRFSGVSLPLDGNDATNKAYVDAAIQGLTFKRPVRVGLLAPALLAALVPGAVVDQIPAQGPTVPAADVTLQVGDRLLLMAQTDATENGIWEVVAGGLPPVRPLDFGGGIGDYHASGNYVFVDQGAQMDRAYVCITDRGADVVGSVPLEWVQFSARQSAMAGFGLEVGSAMELDVDTAVIPWLAAPQNTFEGTIQVPRVTGLQTASITAPGDAVNLDLMETTLRDQHNAAPLKDPVRVAVGYPVASPAAALVVGLSVNRGSAGPCALADGDRVLLVGQADPAENGIWVAGAAGAVRAADMAHGSTVAAGTTVPVADGQVFTVTEAGVVGSGSGFRAVSRQSTLHLFADDVLEADDFTPATYLVADASGSLAVPHLVQPLRVGDRVLLTWNGAAFRGNTVWTVAPFGSQAQIAHDAADIRTGTLVSVGDGRTYVASCGASFHRWTRTDLGRTFHVSVAFPHHVDNIQTSLVHGNNGLMGGSNVLLLGQNDPIECGMWRVAFAGEPVVRSREMQHNQYLAPGTVVTDMIGNVYVFRGCQSDGDEMFRSETSVGVEPLNDWATYSNHHHRPVRHIVDAAVASPAATLVCDAAGVLDLYGLTLCAGDRVMLAGQDSAADNAVWVVAAAGQGPAIRTAELSGRHRDGTVVFDTEGRSVVCRLAADGTRRWTSDRVTSTVRCIIDDNVASPAAAFECPAEGALTVAGIELRPGDRVLLINQTDPSENVVWIVAANGRPVGAVRRLRSDGLDGAVVVASDGASVVCSVDAGGLPRWNASGSGSGAREPVVAAIPWSVSDPGTTVQVGYTFTVRRVAYTLGLGDRVLLMGQAQPVENGIWVAQASGAVRAADMRSGVTVSAGTVIQSSNGDAFVVTEGGTIDSGDGIRTFARHSAEDVAVDFILEDFQAAAGELLPPLLVAGVDGTVRIPGTNRVVRAGARILTPYYKAFEGLNRIWVVAPYGSASAGLSPDSGLLSADTVVTAANGQKYRCLGMKTNPTFGSYLTWECVNLERTLRVVKAITSNVPDLPTTLVSGYENLWVGDAVLLLAQADPCECGVWVVGDADASVPAVRISEMQTNSDVIPGTTVTDSFGNTYVYGGIHDPLDGVAYRAVAGYEPLDNWKIYTPQTHYDVLHVIDAAVADPTNTLVCNYDGVLDLYGLSLHPTERVMLVGQADGNENGIWRVAGAGTPAQRSSEMVLKSRVGITVSDSAGRTVTCSVGPDGAEQWTSAHAVTTVRYILDQMVDYPPGNLVCAEDGTLSVYGLPLAAGDRVLCTAQPNTEDNVVWIVAAAGRPVGCVRRLNGPRPENAVVTDSTGRTVTSVRAGDGSLQWVSTRAPAVKGVVRLAVHTNVTDPTNTLVPGYALANGTTANPGDRILLLAQANPAENGIWVVGDAPCRRSTDMASGSPVSVGTTIPDASGNIFVVTEAGTVDVNGFRGVAQHAMYRPVVSFVIEEWVNDPTNELVAGEDGTLLLPYSGQRATAGDRVLVPATNDARYCDVWVVAPSGSPATLASDSYLTQVGTVVTMRDGRRYILQSQDEWSRTWVDTTTHNKASVTRTYHENIPDPATTLVGNYDNLWPGERVLLLGQDDRTQCGVWVIGEEGTAGTRAADMQLGGSLQKGTVVGDKTGSLYVYQGNVLWWNPTDTDTYSITGYDETQNWARLCNNLLPPVHRIIDWPVPNPAETLRSNENGDVVYCGIWLRTGQRVLLSGQWDASENAIWKIAVAGQAAVRTTELSAFGFLRDGAVVPDTTGRVAVCSIAADGGFQWRSDRIQRPVRFIAESHVENPAAALVAGETGEVVLFGCHLVPNDRVLLTAQMGVNENMVWCVAPAGGAAFPVHNPRESFHGMVILDAGGRTAVCTQLVEGEYTWRITGSKPTVHRIVEELLGSPATDLVCGPSGTLTIAGATLYPGDRVLLTSQITYYENTVWLVAAEGSVAAPVVRLVDLHGLVVTDFTGNTAACNMPNGDTVLWTVSADTWCVEHTIWEPAGPPEQVLVCDETGTTTVNGVTMQPGERVLMINQGLDTLQFDTVWTVAAAGGAVRSIPPNRMRRGLRVIDRTGRTFTVVPGPWGLRWRDLSAVQQPQKAAVVAATTDAIPYLSMNLRTGLVVDGVPVVAGQRVLVKNQEVPAENGVWIVAEPYTETQRDYLRPVRASDLPKDVAFVGSVVRVAAGTINKGTSWMADGPDGPAGRVEQSAMGWKYQSGTRGRTMVCQTATTEPIEGGPATGLVPNSLVDGVTLIVGMRVLVYHQADPVENGVYEVTATGAVRAPEMPEGDCINGVAVCVTGGLVNRTHVYMCISWVGFDVVGTSQLHFNTLLNHTVVPWLGEQNTFTGVNTFTASTVFNGSTHITDPTAATSQTSAALVIDGGLGVGGDVFCSSMFHTSDERLKTDFRSLSGDALGVIEALGGYDFAWKDSGNSGESEFVAANEALHRSGRTVGVKAQEVEAAGALHCVARNGEGILSVDYTKLVPYLIEAVKTLKRKVDVLEGTAASPPPTARSAKRSRTTKRK